MRKLIGFMAAVVATAVVGVGFVKVCEYANQYNMSAQVQSINGNEISFIDDDGNVWVWYAEKGDVYKVGEHATLRMDFAGTDNNIYDDVIITVTK